MCLTERVSWTTLIIGTFTNIIILSYLTRMMKKDVNAIIPIVIILTWQYALLMQLPDALGWRYPDSKSKFPGKLSFFLNTTQPLIFFLLICIALKKLKIPLIRLLPAFLVIIVYVIWWIYYYRSINFDLKPLIKCKNLNYRWWTLKSIVLYIIIFVLIILTIFPSFGHIILFLSIYFGSLLTSHYYSNNCFPGSLWCWSVASAGLITFLYYMVNNSQKYLHF
jgi:hypothetical protein